MSHLKTPILFIIFNRPDLSERVFQEIRKVKPSRLYISADAPRKNIPEDINKCRKAREIINKIDWKCDVHTKFNEKNLGCKLAVSSAIDWFFLNEENGIVLEDDCLPANSFFWFCQELLEYYKYDSRVMHISGTNLLGETSVGDGSYFFSKRAITWGWATWRRAWQFYDLGIKSLPEFIVQDKMKSIYNLPYLQNAYLNAFKIMHNGEGDTWDWQWVYTVMCQNGLAIIPNKNLIKNIGFREDATHTFSKNVLFSNIQVHEDMEIIHPKFVLHDYTAEIEINREFAKKSKWRKTVNSIKKRFKRIADLL